MNWQTGANFTQKRRKSLFAVEEGVILLPAEIRRFRGSFRDNRGEPYQGVSGMDGKLGEHLPVRNRNGTLAYLLRRVGARLHGEWFERSPELMAEIAKVGMPTHAP